MQNNCLWDALWTMKTWTMNHPIKTHLKQFKNYLSKKYKILLIIVFVTVLFTADVIVKIKTYVKK